LSQNLASSYNPTQQILQQEANNRVTSKTAPARLEGFDDDDDNNALFKVILKQANSRLREWCARIVMFRDARAHHTLLLL
jgi:hypothetical protein